MSLSAHETMENYSHPHYVELLHVFAADANMTPQEYLQTAPS